MLSSIVGNVELPAAAVLIALCICICIMVTTMIAKRRSRVDVSNEFELAKIRLQDAKEVSFAQISNKRDYDMKQLEAGLITSHKSS